VQFLPSLPIVVLYIDDVLLINLKSVKLLCGLATTVACKLESVSFCPAKK